MNIEKTLLTLGLLALAYTSQAQISLTITIPAANPAASALTNATVEFNAIQKAANSNWVDISPTIYLSNRVVDTLRSYVKTEQRKALYIDNFEKLVEAMSNADRQATRAILDKYTNSL